MATSPAEEEGRLAERPVRLLSGRKAARSRHAVPARVPIALRSAVHGTVSRGRFDQPWSRRIVLVKWAMSGGGAIEVADRRLTFGPGQVAVRLPSDPHRFWSLSDTTEMCWFSVDGPLAEDFVLHLGLASGVHPYGPAPVARIERLMDALRDETPQGWRRASELAVESLYEVASNTEIVLPSALVLRAQHRIEDGFADPDLSVARIAADLECHRATLSDAFRKETGVTVIEYITRVRLREAVLLLRETEDPIGLVGSKCGLCDPVYFSHWCRKHTGSSPSQIRRSQTIAKLSDEGPHPSPPSSQP